MQNSYFNGNESGYVALLGSMPQKAIPSGSNWCDVETPTPPDFALRGTHPTNTLIPPPTTKSPPHFSIHPPLSDMGLNDAPPVTVAATRLPLPPPPPSASLNPAHAHPWSNNILPPPSMPSSVGRVPLAPLPNSNKRHRPVAQSPACINCRTAKTKCDRLQPCTRCVRKRTQCIPASRSRTARLCGGRDGGTLRDLRPHHDHLPQPVMRSQPGMLFAGLNGKENNGLIMTEGKHPHHPSSLATSAWSSVVGEPVRPGAAEGTSGSAVWCACKRGCAVSPSTPPPPTTRAWCTSASRAARPLASCSTRSPLGRW